MNLGIGAFVVSEYYGHAQIERTLRNKSLKRKVTDKNGR